MNSTHIPEEVLPTTVSKPGKNEVQRVIVYNVDFRMTDWSNVTQTHTITDSLYS